MKSLAKVIRSTDRPFSQPKHHTDRLVADWERFAIENKTNRTPCACGGGCPRCQQDAGGLSAHDFSGVRIHSDAPEVTTPLRARAVTMGQDIYFHPGQYRPGTPEGEHLLAHELAHTLQTRQTNALAGDPPHSISQPSDALEQNADALASGTTDHALAAPAGMALRSPSNDEITEEESAAIPVLETDDLSTPAELISNYRATIDEDVINRAKRKAERKDGVDARIINAAIKSGADEPYFSNHQLDAKWNGNQFKGGYLAEKHTNTPVSKIAPRERYEKISADKLALETAGRHDNRGDRTGNIEAGFLVDVTEDRDENLGLRRRLNITIIAAVKKRRIVPERIGPHKRISPGGSIYAHKEGSSLTLTEQEFLQHEQLHVVIDARTARAVEAFASAAFGQSAATDPVTLKDELRKLAEGVASRVHQWYHSETATKFSNEQALIRSTQRTSELLNPGNPEIEDVVRTKLIDAVRSSSRRLARIALGKVKRPLKKGKRSKARAKP